MKTKLCMSLIFKSVVNIPEDLFSAANSKIIVIIMHIVLLREIKIGRGKENGRERGGGEKVSFETLSVFATIVGRSAFVVLFVVLVFVLVLVVNNIVIRHFYFGIIFIS